MIYVHAQWYTYLNPTLHCLISASHIRGINGDICYERIDAYNLSGDDCVAKSSALSIFLCGPDSELDEEAGALLSSRLFWK